MLSGKPFAYSCRRGIYTEYCHILGARALLCTLLTVNAVNGACSAHQLCQRGRVGAALRAWPDRRGKRDGALPARHGQPLGSHHHGGPRRSRGRPPNDLRDPSACTQEKTVPPVFFALYCQSPGIRSQTYWGSGACSRTAAGRVLRMASLLSAASKRSSVPCNKEAHPAFQRCLHEEPVSQQSSSPGCWGCEHVLTAAEGAGALAACAAGATAAGPITSVCAI